MTFTYTHTHAHTCTHMKAALLLLAFAGTAASAQLSPINVSPQIQASEDGVEWWECSVAVRSDNKFELMVMGSGETFDAQQKPVRFLGYTTIQYPSLVPLVTKERLEGCGSGDVWVTADSSNGRIWFVALAGTGFDGGGEQLLAPYEDDESVELFWASNANCTGALNIGWKEPNVTVINDVYSHSNDFQDKPALAIGGDQTTKYPLLRQQKPGNCSAHQHEAGQATMPTDGASAWTDYTLEADPGQPGCHYEGWGVAPVVLDASLASDGRVVAAIRDEKPKTGGKYNSGLPYVVYSDDGIDWKPDPSGGNVTPILLGGPSIEATTTKGSSTDPGDTPWHVDRRNHAPSVAVRYLEGIDDEVYVAFAARAAQSSTNTDIYISKSLESQTGLINFPGPNNQEFFQVTDTFLGTPTGTDGADQFVPAIAVDSCGGVNLMFYDNRHDPDRTDSIELVDVYYARIANYGTGTEWVFQQRLTPQSIRVDNLDGTRFLGDYHNLTVSADGKTIYAAYISRDNADPVAGDRTCYVHRIDISCSGPLAEMTGDGSVTGADATAFSAAWTAGEPAADTNLDMVVNADDLVDYLLTFSEEAE